MPIYPNLKHVAESTRNNVNKPILLNKQLPRITYTPKIKEFTENFENQPSFNKEGYVCNAGTNQCSDWVTKDAVRRLGFSEADPSEFNTALQTWKNETGARGDAWQIHNNLLSKGANERYNSYTHKGSLDSLRVGDVVGMYNTKNNSPYQGQADQNGKGVRNTHVGKVLKLLPNGDKIVRHNIHNSVYDSRVSKDGNVLDSGYGYNYQVVTGASPKATNLNVKGFREKLNTFDDSNKLVITTPGYENTVSTAFVNSLNKNKKDIMMKTGISESEYNRLAKDAFGILGRESKFGQANSYKLKSFGASGEEGIGLYEGIVDAYKKLRGDLPSSKGLTRMKTDPVMADQFDVNVRMNNTPEKSAVLTMLNMIQNYKKLKNSPAKVTSQGIDASVMRAHLTPNYSKKAQRKLSSGNSTYVDGGYSSGSNWNPFSKAGEFKGSSDYRKGLSTINNGREVYDPDDFYQVNDSLQRMNFIEQLVKNTPNRVVNVNDLK